METPQADDTVAGTTVLHDSAARPEPPPGTPIQAEPRPRRWGLIIGGVVLVAALIVGGYWIVASWNSVSTDDAYIAGHVTSVAARVPGQVARVLVEDNNRVHKGDLLVELDRKPYEVQAEIARSAVAAARADLVAAQAQARGFEGQTRGLRFLLQHAIEDVDNQIAVLRSRVATLQSQQASLAKARADYERALPLLKSGAVSTEEIDLRKETMLVAQAKVEEALQGVYQVRASLGLPAKPQNGGELTDVPSDLDQTFSSVRQAQANLMQAAAQLGVYDSFNKTPRQMIADFYKRDPQENIDRIYAKLVEDAPSVKQAEAKLIAAQRNLDQAELNLSYCSVVAEIDGVVTRRDVNPGNNVQAGQGLMAVRSLTEIWVDANFKETQLAKLRIGQPVELDVDMYGSQHRFKGRVSGFTMGTGSTLALLPAENATGNFVKVVQRLPVRIEVTDYDPDRTPLFIGLSVTATVNTAASAEGPDAGKVLQPYLPTPVATMAPTTAPTTAPRTAPEKRP